MHLADLDAISITEKAGRYERLVRQGKMALDPSATTPQAKATAYVSWLKSGRPAPAANVIPIASTSPVQSPMTFLLIAGAAVAAFFLFKKKAR